LINAQLHACLLRDAQLHVFDDGHLFMLTRALETARVVGEFLAEPTTRLGGPASTADCLTGSPARTPA
jgi:hypothetical protein